MNRSNHVKMLTLVLLSTLLAAGCSSNSAETAGSTVSPTAASAAQSSGAASTTALQLASLNAAEQADFDDADALTAWSKDSSTAIVLSSSGVSIDGSGVAADGGILTITAAGTYVVSGNSSDGQILVDAPDAKVHLVLNGVQISKDDGPAIYVKEADNTIVTLQDGTDNTISDGAAYADTSEDAPTAAIYSKGDLAINGTGRLSVLGNANDGITSKDDLKIMSGTINVKAADDGVIGRDLLAVKDGQITINAGGDGMKTTNDTDADKGYVALAGGTFNITSANDGIQAASLILIGGGTFNIVSGGGSAASTKMHQEQPPRGFGGQPQAQTEYSDTESESAKALKAAADTVITDGSFWIDAADDAIHGNANVAISGGTYSIASGDDGIHAETALLITNGTIQISKSYEGIEGSDISVSGGEIHVTASDDGVNVGGGNDSAGGGDMFSATDGTLTISGGYMYVDATGDGLDSNGSIVMSGGTAVVNGPTSDGNGPLDYNGTFKQSGGYLIAAGSSRMAQAPSADSSQRAILMTFSNTLEAGTLVNLTDSEGTTIASFAPAKSFSSIVISSPDLKAGAAYTISTGGISTGTATDGLFKGGTSSGGTNIVTFTMGDTVTYVNESGVTTANTGGPGGGPGGGGHGMGGHSRPGMQGGSQSN